MRMRSHAAHRAAPSWSPVRARGRGAHAPRRGCSRRRARSGTQRLRGVRGRHLRAARGLPGVSRRCPTPAGRTPRGVFDCVGHGSQCCTGRSTWPRPLRQGPMGATRGIDGHLRLPVSGLRSSDELVTVSRTAGPLRAAARVAHPRRSAAPSERVGRCHGPRGCGSRVSRGGDDERRRRSLARIRRPRGCAGGRDARGGVAHRAQRRRAGDGRLRGRLRLGAHRPRRRAARRGAWPVATSRRPTTRRVGSATHASVRRGSQRCARPRRPSTTRWSSTRGSTSSSGVSSAGADPATQVDLVPEALERANAYLDAGADCVYPIALWEPTALRRFMAGVAGPVNVTRVPQIAVAGRSSPRPVWPG